MIKLTEFTSVVDTYKKNFDIRKKRFSLVKRGDLRKRREKREKRIETSKLFNTKTLKDGVKKQSGDILDNLLRFGLFTLLGFLLKNIDKVVLTIKNIVDKVKEFAKNLKTFYEDTLKPLFESLSGLAPIVGSVFGFIGNFIMEMNPFNSFGDLLDTVIYGILGMASKLGMLNKPQVKPPSGTALRKQPTLPKAKVPARVKTAARVRSTFAARQSKIAAQRSFLRRSTPQGVSRTAAAAGLGRTPGADFPVGTRITQSVVDEMKENIRIQADEEARLARNRVEIRAREAIAKKAALDKKFFDKFGIEGGDKFTKAQAAQFFDDFLFTPDGPGASGTSVLDDLVGKPPKPNFFKNVFDRVVEGSRRGGAALKDFGMGFRFNPKDVVNFLKNPKNLKDLAKGSILGLAFEAGAKSLATSISDALPFSENFQLLAYFGLISKERIFDLKAQQLMKMSPEKRRRFIEKYKKHAESNPFFLDSIGLQNKENATMILQRLAPLLAAPGGAEGNEDLIEALESLKIKPTVEPKQPVIPQNEIDILDDFINKTDPNKKANEDNFTIDGSRVNIGDEVGSLQMDTTYSSGGVRTIANNVVVLQTIREEVPV
tara:strand:- start:114 stop:1916 length:1803 start_codon:yes stop_codon:yes gene_type:complete